MKSIGFNNEGDKIKRMVFSPQNRFFAISVKCGQGEKSLKIIVYSSPEFEIIKTIDLTYSKDLSQIIFSNDSKHLIAASIDKSIHIFDSSKNFKLESKIDVDSEVMAIAVTARKSILLFGDNGGNVGQF